MERGFCSGGKEIEGEGVREKVIGVARFLRSTLCPRVIGALMRPKARTSYHLVDFFTHVGMRLCSVDCHSKGRPGVRRKGGEGYLPRTQPKLLRR